MKIKSLFMTAATLIGTPALAQTSANTQQQFTGRLESNSPQDDGHPYQVRTMALEAGTRYAFSAESDDFDPALRVSLADDNDETIAEDDDSGEGTNAYIELSPARSGNYRVRVRSVNNDKGDYLLKVKNLPPLPPLARPAPVGSTTIVFNDYTGALTASDGEINGHYVDDYVFRFEGGKKVMISLDGNAADDLDPLVKVYPAGDRYASKPLASDDDSGDKLNAFLVFRPEQSGEFIVRATNSGDEHETGSYRLRVGQEP